MPKRRKLTDADWAAVFTARCQSKQGRPLSKEESALCEAAFKSGRARYEAMTAAVFNATVPFGSSVRWTEKKVVKKKPVKHTTTQKALLYLHKHGPSGCSDVGTIIDKRNGRISSVNGGGDYAAQMMLGRMRKAGLVRVGNSDGSSKWELTPAGRDLAKKLVA